MAKGIEVVAADLDDEGALPRRSPRSRRIRRDQLPEISRWKGSSSRPRTSPRPPRPQTRRTSSGRRWTTNATATAQRSADADAAREEQVPALRSKGQIDHVFTDLGLPVTFLLTSFYWDNFYKYGWGPKPGKDGAFSLTFPTGRAENAGYRGRGHRQMRVRRIQKGPGYRQEGRRRRRAAERFRDGRKNAAPRSASRVRSTPFRPICIAI